MLVEHLHIGNVIYRRVETLAEGELAAEDVAI